MKCPQCGDYEFEWPSPCADCKAELCRSCAGKSIMAGAGKTLCDFCLGDWREANWDGEYDDEPEEDYSEMQERG